MSKETRRHGPAPRYPGRVRRAYAPQLELPVITAIEQEAARREVSMARVVGDILEKWYLDKLLSGLDD